MQPLTGAIPETTDCLVIGSGFGGSVAAATLAGAGREVCLLERGKAYPPGSFPRAPDEMARNFWDPSAGLYGLFNVWSFEHVDAIVASGLGGGSLIYANVMLEKPEAWFAQPISDGDGEEVWSFTYDDLLEHYEAVRDFLDVDTIPEELIAAHSPKTIRFMQASEQMGVYAPLAVRFRDSEGAPAIGAPLPPEPYGSIFGTPRRTTCRMVGECDIGCNEGAKSSMDHTFLSKAHAHGARIHPRTEVRTLRRLDDPAQPFRFEVSYVEHPQWAEGQPRDTRGIEGRTIKARRVILAAGAMGSTYLMLKNARELGVPATAPLGKRFCDNGDLLGLAMPGRATQNFTANKGPVITAYRRFDEPGDDGTPAVRMYLQDGGVPTIMLWILKTAGAPGLIARLFTDGLDYWWQRVTRSNDNNVSAEASEVMGVSPAIVRSLPILGMGEDVPGGATVAERRWHLAEFMVSQRVGSPLHRGAPTDEFAHASSRGGVQARPRQADRTHHHRPSARRLPHRHVPIQRCRGLLRPGARGAGTVDRRRVGAARTRRGQSVAHDRRVRASCRHANFVGRSQYRARRRYVFASPRVKNRT